ncbi:MAG: TetR/AcrR family transcriptional regulator [Spirochaetales bacterium]|nr:TetR/AcrR family transcriptional regulator [Candidatus Physcosoma equi]
MSIALGKRGTKTVMVEAAIGLFREKGVDNVSVKEICDSAHVTRNAFYYHFKTKELLFDAIGDYLTRYAKNHIKTLFERNSAYHHIWEIYKPFLEYQIYLGPDIMNHCCLSRTCKGRADTYMYIDEEMIGNLKTLVEIAKKNGEVTSQAESDALAYESYAIVRGHNIGWCFRWGESDLLRDAMKALDTLFVPNPGYRLVRD